MKSMTFPRIWSASNENITSPELGFNWGQACEGCRRGIRCIEFAQFLRAYFSIDEHGRDITCPIWWSQSTCCLWMARNTTNLRTCLGFRSEICSIPIIRWQVDTFCFLDPQKHDSIPSADVTTTSQRKCITCYVNLKEVTTRFTRSRAKMKTSETFLLRGIIVYQWNPSTTTESWDFRAGQLDQFVGLAASWILKEGTLKSVGILQVSKDVLTRALRSNPQSWTLNLTIVMQGWLQLWNGIDESY